MNTIQSVKEPMNAKLMDPSAVIEAEGLLPVTTYMIHEPSTNTFHPDGLFSEVIFGSIGSPDRLIRFGYIDLKTPIFNPTIFTNILKLSSFYKGILEGKTYAKFDTKTKNFVIVDRDEVGARTGFEFFTEYIHRVEFVSTGSLIREARMEVLDTYKSNLLSDKLLVLPAGIRDVKEDDTGRVTIEDVNKLYLSILALTDSLPDDENAIKDPVFDPVKYTIQMKVMELYNYIFNDIIGGKRGYGSGKFGSRNIALGARNVITAAPLTSVKSPMDADYFKNDEALLPLYQCMKSSMPLIQYTLKSTVLDMIFGEATGEVPLINPNTYEMEYMEISEDTRSLYTSADGLERLINRFDNEHTIFKPFAIPVLNQKFKYGWAYLIYDLGDRIYRFRDINQFRHDFQGQTQWKLTELITSCREVLDSIGTDNFYISYGSAMEVYGYTDIPTDTVDILVNSTTYKKLSIDDSRIKVHEVENFSEVRKACNDVDGYLVVNLETLVNMYEPLIKEDSKYRFKYQWVKDSVIDMSKVRPMTNVETFYITTYLALHDKYTTFTRHPVLDELGILTNKVAVASTEPSRVVAFGPRVRSSKLSGVTFPRYPSFDNSKLRGSMSPHPSSLPGFGGDFDGDVCGAIILLSEDSTKENKEHFKSISSMVNSNKGLYRGLAHDDVNKFTYFNLGYMPRK